MINFRYNGDVSLPMLYANYDKISKYDFGTCHADDLFVLFRQEGIKEDLKSVACFGITPQILTSGSNGNCKAGNLTKFWPLLAELAASASVEVLVSLAFSLAPAESANKVWSFSIFLLLTVKYLN